MITYKIVKNIQQSIAYTIFAILLVVFMLPITASAQKADDGIQCYQKSFKEACEKDNQAVFKENAEGCPDGMGRCVVKPPSITLNTQIPGLDGVDAPVRIDEYIETIFTWLLRVGGVVAALVLVWGGYTYITAAGNQARMSMAKEIILGGIIGIILLFGSVTLLGFVNNRLISSDSFEVDYIFTKDASFNMCTIEESKSVVDNPSLVTCGQSINVQNGTKSCISSWCGSSTLNNGGNLICIKTEVGGVYSTKIDYTCIDITNEEALKDSCEITQNSSCDYIAQYMPNKGTFTKTCAPHFLGICKVLPPLECRTANNELRTSCSACGVTANDLSIINGRVVDQSGTTNPVSIASFCTDAPHAAGQFFQTIDKDNEEDKGLPDVQRIVNTICCYDENAKDYRLRPSTVQYYDY